MNNEKNEAVDTAYKGFMETMQTRGVFQSEEQSSAIKQSLKLFYDICSSTKTDRYVLPIPAGAGKTTALESWCVTISDLNLGYSVSIASSQVEELFKIRENLIKLGIKSDNIGMLYSDKQKDKKKYREICLPTDTPQLFQFLLVTHKRYEMSPDRLNYQTYRGKERNIIFWDEQFRRFECKTQDKLVIQQELAGLLYVFDKKEFDCLEDKKLVKEFIEQTLKAIQLDSPEAAEDIEVDCSLYKSYDIEDHQRLIKAVRNLKLSKDTFNFCKFILESNCKMYLLDNKIALIKKVIDDDIKRMAILDASYHIDGISQLDKTTQLEPIYYPRQYPNLTVTHRGCNSGKTNFTKLLTGDSQLMNEVLNTIKALPKNEPILICTFKEEPLVLVKSKLIQLGVSLDEKTDQGFYRINFLTWGKEKGTNDYVHCQHFINIGLLDIGSDNLKTLAIAETEGDFLRYPKDQHFSCNDLQERDYANRLYQALSRIAIRNPNFKSKCTVTLFVHSDGYIKHLQTRLKGADFLMGEPIFKKKEVKAESGFKILLDIISQLPESSGYMSSKELFSKLRDHTDTLGFVITDGVVRGIRKRLRQHFIFNSEWVYEGRGIKRIRYV